MTHRISPLKRAAASVAMTSSMAAEGADRARQRRAAVRPHALRQLARGWLACDMLRELRPDPATLPHALPSVECVGVTAYPPGLGPRLAFLLDYPPRVRTLADDQRKWAAVPLQQGVALG